MTADLLIFIKKISFSAFFVSLYPTLSPFFLLSIIAQMLGQLGKLTLGLMCRREKKKKKKENLAIAG